SSHVLHSFPTRRSSDLSVAASYQETLFNEFRQPAKVTLAQILSGASAQRALNPLRVPIQPSVENNGRVRSIGLEIADECCGILRSEEHTSELQSRFDLV